MNFGCLPAWLMLVASFTAWSFDIGAETSTGVVTGKLLVATERMPDPRFAETVIYMVQHGPEGAIGVVLNRPIQVVPVAEILRGFGDEDVSASGSIRLLAGGPVHANAGYVLHSADYAAEHTLVVDGDIAFTVGVQALRDKVAGKGPARALLFLGMSSWAPGQLEAELGTPGWVIVPADPEFVFDDDLGSKWQRAMDRFGVEL
ncbi:MAG: hypothetical protein GY791_12270 [Alphaproteobacteria bacterium]|nr:hypothetical protein [Alphaproteobacteria bacterium]